MKRVPVKTCPICGMLFKGERNSQSTCSFTCGQQSRLRKVAARPHLHDIKIIDGIESKWCSTCCHDKPLIEFYRHPKGHHQTRCKPCHRAAMKQRLDANPAIRKHDAVVMRANPQRYQDYLRRTREYYQQHRGELLEYATHYRNQHRDKINQKIRAWAKTPHGKHCMRSRQRRRSAALAGVRLLGSHTYQEWEKVKAAHSYRCAICFQREPTITLTKDHIVPISTGGSDNITNIQPLCHRCNSHKRNTLNRYIASATVIDGHLKLTDKRSFEAALRAFPDGPVTISVGPPKRQRSTAQLAYYWAVIVALLSEHTGYSTDEIHVLLKTMFLPKHITIRQRDGTTLDETTIPGSTSELSTTEFSDYCATIQQWAAEKLNVYIPDPNEYVA